MKPPERTVPAHYDDEPTFGVKNGNLIDYPYRAHIDLATEVLGEELEVAPRADRDLAYETGSWVRYLFADAVEREKTLADAVARHPGTEWPSFVRELFARLYGTASALDPVPLGGEWAAALHDNVSSLREWKDLAAECKGDDELAIVAAEQVARSMKLPHDPPPDPRVAADEAAESGDAAEAQEALQRCEESIMDARHLAQKVNEPKAASAMRRALRSACAKATQDAKDTKEAVAMLGCGDDPPREQRIVWKHRIHADRRIVAIARLAGRMEAVLEADRAEAISDDGRDDIVGVKHGHRVSDAVPMERALFALEDFPELGLLQIGKMAEGRLLQNRQVGLIDEQKAGKGPLVFACDESGSMGGYGEMTPNVVAKAIMLTLMRACAEEGRTFAVVHWSTKTKTSVFPKGQSMNRAVLDEVCCFLDGGTDLPLAINTAASIVRGEQAGVPKEDAERADVVLLTDCEYYEHGTSTKQAVDELHATGARLFTFHVDNGPPHQLLQQMSARYLQIREDLLSDGTALALSIHKETMR